jgi:hypothetical protein
MYSLNNQLSTGTLSAESVPFFIGEIMKILFLDIDGVLNSLYYSKKRHLSI